MPEKTEGARPARQALTVERIVATAVAMIDADGLDGFSMRKLGGQLRADPMAVYHYFPSKAALFDAVVESVYCEIDFAGVDEAWWDEAVASYGHRMRDALVRHPHVLPILATRPVSTLPVLVLIEAMASQLVRAGAKPTEALLMVNCLAMFVTGHLLADVGEPVGGPEAPGSESPDVDPSAVPTLVSAMSEGWTFDSDRIFDEGLRALIAGFARRYGLR